MSGRQGSHMYVGSYKALGYNDVRVLPQDICVVHCWLINPNKLNLLSWLLAYLSHKKVHGTNILNRSITRQGIKYTCAHASMLVGLCVSFSAIYRNIVQSHFALTVYPLG